MKRSLVLVPIILLVLLNACGQPNSGGISPELWTAMAGTLTATNMPPTITPTGTYLPNGQWLVTSLNSVSSQYAGSGNWENRGGMITDTGVAVNLDQLEDVIGSDLHILDVQFPLAGNGPAVNFQVYARCECATDSQCCTPEHMFVLTLRNLYMAVQPYLYPQVYLAQGQAPSSIEELQVLCYDHNRPMATMVAPWSAVQSFLLGQINGYQLGIQVHRQ
jgi:hypothetical protein